MEKSYERAVEVCKVDAELGIVFGWGIISKQDGEPYYDLQGDHIPEDSMLKAAADFMESSRVAGEMHKNGKVEKVEERGAVLFALPLTAEIAKSLEIETKKTGLIIAVKPDADMLAKFKSGALTGFSIGGFVLKDEVGKGAGDYVDLVSSIEGEHQHGISVQSRDGRQFVKVEFASGPQEERQHNHPIYLENNEYRLGVVAGHTHTVDANAAANVLRGVGYYGV